MTVYVISPDLQVHLDYAIEHPGRFYVLPLGIYCDRHVLEQAERDRPDVAGHFEGRHRYVTDVRGWRTWIKFVEEEK